MNLLNKVLLLELAFFLGIPLIGVFLCAAFGTVGALIFAILFGIWCWALYAYFLYCPCRPEGFRGVVQPAGGRGRPGRAKPREARESGGHLCGSAVRHVDRVDLHPGQGGEVRITDQTVGERCVIPLLPAVPA